MIEKQACGLTTSFISQLYLYIHYIVQSLHHRVRLSYILEILVCRSSLSCKTQDGPF